MRRPDHFERPVQSDRSLHDYGHTRLTPDEPDFEPVWVALTIVVAGFVGLVIYALIERFA